MIQYLLTFSCPSPRYDRPANSAFEDEQTRELLEILADYPPWHRILHTRDLDGPMHITGHEVWFILLTDWTGKAEPAAFGIGREDFAAKTRPYVETYTDKFTEVPDPATDLDAPPVVAAGPAPLTASTLAGAATAPANRIDLPPLSTEDRAQVRSGAFAPKALADLAADNERHPVRCLFMPALDRLPGFGDDQVHRHRLSAILGNDYTSGVGGITWPIAASGVLDGILGMSETDWADEGTLSAMLSEVLANLAGRTAAAKSWRAHAPHGKVGKIEDRFGTLAGGKAAELIAAVRVIRCEEVNLIPADAHWKGNGRGPLAFGLSPPLVRSDAPTGSNQPSHPYVLRPNANHAIPTDPSQPQVLPTSPRDLRCDNGMQARRSIAAPGQNNFIAMQQSAWQVRPSAPGESDLAAMFDYGPEIGDFAPEDVERLLRPSGAAEKGRPDDKQKEEDEEGKDDGDEQDELEDDLAELDDAPEYKGQRASASTRLEDIYGICSSPERDHRVARTFSDLTRPSYIPARAPSQSQSTAAPSPSSAAQTKVRLGRSGAEQRAARRRRLHNGGRPVPVPSRRRARAAAPAVPAAPPTEGGPSPQTSEAAIDDGVHPPAASPGDGPIHIPPEASVEPMLLWLPLAMNLGLPFVRMALTTLVEQSIARGETGIRRLAEFGGTRNNLAQTMARIAAGAAKEATGNWFPGESVSPKEDEAVRPRR